MGVAIMALIYLFGILSGIVLVVIALIGWIRQSSRTLEERRNIETNTGAISMASDRPNRRHRDDRPTAAAA